MLFLLPRKSGRNLSFDGLLLRLLCFLLEFLHLGGALGLGLCLSLGRRCFQSFCVLLFPLSSLGSQPFLSCCLSCSRCRCISLVLGCLLLSLLSGVFLSFHVRFMSCF